MGLFRRKKGRHALGAAVTSIPSGPLQAVTSAPVASAPVAGADEDLPSAALSPRAEPNLMTSIAELIASGEAWVTDAGEELPSSPSAWSSVEAAFAELLPAQSSQPIAQHVTRTDAEPQRAVAAGRVQLGFRDGTSTTLDPACSQAMALEELAQSLTRRD